MLEIKQVLTAVLNARKLHTVADGFERPQRRNITIKPGRGGLAWLPRRPAGQSPTR